MKSSTLLKCLEMMDKSHRKHRKILKILSPVSHQSNSKISFVILLSLTISMKSGWKKRKRTLSQLKDFSHFIKWCKRTTLALLHPTTTRSTSGSQGIIRIFSKKLILPKPLTNTSNRLKDISPSVLFSFTVANFWRKKLLQTFEKI